MSDGPTWGAGWSREAFIAHGVRLAEIGFGIVRVYRPLSPTRCSCEAGEACGRNNGKHPIGKAWEKQAEHDPERVRTMLGNVGNESYGIVPPPGVFEWDVDKDAPERLRALSAELGPLPPTRVHRSGNGKHVFYRWPADVPRPSGNVFGLTTRWAPGGMVVGPGSVHAATGRLYAVENDGPITELAASWARAAGDWSNDLHRRQDTARPGDDEWVIPKDHRHDFLKRSAARLRYIGLRGDALRDALAALNRERCADGGKPEAEIVDLAHYFDGKDDGGPGVFLDTGQRPEARAERRALTPFATAAALAAEAPPDWRYIARPWAVAGAITELDGKPKTAGKTTFLLHLIRAVLDGAPFLGEPTTQTPVVLLSEQSRRSLVPTLRALGLARDELLLLTWPDAIGANWEGIVGAAVGECRRIGARLLAVDTLTPFVGLGAEMENDASAALAAMRPLQAAAQDDELAVLVTRHDRKSGGDVAESGRGSNAWSGAVDCVMALRRQANPARSSIRELEAISRRGDVPDEPLLVELTEAGYIALGAPAAVAFDEARQMVRDCLSAQHDGPLGGQTLDELAAALDRPRATLQRAVRALLAADELERTGKGRAGDPFRYVINPGSAESAQRPPLRGGPSVGQTSDTEPALDLTTAARAVFGDMLKDGSGSAVPTDSSAMVPRRTDA